MMPEQPQDPRLGSVIAGYRIDSRIGRGGMGVVYVAEHKTLRRQAALKIIVPDLAENPDFAVDPYYNRLGVTHCPGGFLRRSIADR